MGKNQDQEPQKKLMASQPGIPEKNGKSAKKTVFAGLGGGSELYELVRN